MPLLRLSRREYNNTVRDLLGDVSNQANAFSSDRESEFLFRARRPGRHPGPR